MVPPIQVSILDDRLASATLRRLFRNLPLPSNQESWVELVSEDWNFTNDFRREFFNVTFPIDAGTVVFITAPMLHHINRVNANNPAIAPRPINLEISILGTNDSQIRQLLTSDTINSDIINATEPYLRDQNPERETEAYTLQGIIAALDRIYFELAYNVDLFKAPNDLQLLRRGFISLLNKVKIQYDFNFPPEQENEQYVRGVKKGIEERINIIEGKILQQSEIENSKRTYRWALATIIIAVLIHGLASILAQQPWKKK